MDGDGRADIAVREQVMAWFVALLVFLFFFGWDGLKLLLMLALLVFVVLLGTVG